MEIAAIIAAAAAAAGYLFMRAALAKPKEYQIKPTAASFPPADRTIRHLSEAVQIPTVPMGEHAGTMLLNFHQWLEEAYPLVHKHLSRTILSDYTLVYHWEGSDASLEPVLCTAHIDVVPPGDDADLWLYPPFSGAVEDGYLWGRGSMDIKVQIVALMESVEHLLESGHQPVRSLYMVFGHDEETEGDGAKAAAQYFTDKGLRFLLVHDEGGCVTDGIIAGVNRPVANIGIAEKGYMDVELEARQAGGHTSMPGRTTSLGELAQALVNLERHQFPLRMTRVTAGMFEALAPYMPILQRMLIVHRRIFSPLLLRIISRTSTGNAMVRTTTAPTMAQASNAPNVLPPSAQAVINFRLLHGDTSRTAADRIRKTIQNTNISITLKRREEPSAVTDTKSPGYQAVERTILQVFPESVTAPFLMIGGTDARRYEGLSDGICRFSPYILTRSELDRLHGYDERISLENISSAVRFYLQLFANVDI